MDLAEKLKDVRAHLGMSQSEVAKEMGWTRPDGEGNNSVISLIEQGKKREKAVELALHYIKHHGIKRSMFFLDDLPDRVDRLESQMDVLFDQLEKISKRLDE